MSESTLCTVTAAAAAAFGLLLSGCSGSSGASGAPSTPSATPGVPVTVGSKPVGPVLTAPRQPLRTPVRYRDGITVAVVGIRESVEHDTGPGSFPGRANTTFRLRFDNGSTRPLSIDAVQVSASYGRPRAEAPPVYSSGETHDFTGTVAPGRSATAPYTFAIPVNGRRHVVLQVTFDDRHSAAVFVGRA